MDERWIQFVDDNVLASESLQADSRNMNIVTL